MQKNVVESPTFITFRKLFSYCIWRVRLSRSLSNWVLALFARSDSLLCNQTRESRCLRLHQREGHIPRLNDETASKNALVTPLLLEFLDRRIKIEIGFRREIRHTSCSIHESPQLRKSRLDFVLSSLAFWRSLPLIRQSTVPRLRTDLYPSILVKASRLSRRFQASQMFVAAEKKPHAKFNLTNIRWRRVLSGLSKERHTSSVGEFLSNPR